MDQNEWESPTANKPTECGVCEAMLPDAVDGLLTEGEQKAFDKHVATCTQCAQELEEAQRGAAWLQMLKGSSPEPSPLLLSKILAQTTGAIDLAAAGSAANTPEYAAGAAQERGTENPLQMMPDGTVGARVPQAPVRESLGAFVQRKLVDIFSIQKATMHFQPRLAMTAAMAFFSVALTLNMTGVKLGNLKAANLRPSVLRRTVADTSASAMRSFQNMRVVYQFESKLEDIRDSSNSPRTDSQGNGGQQDDSSGNTNKQRGDEQDGGKGSKGSSGSQQSPRGHSTLEFPLARRNASEQGV